VEEKINILLIEDNPADARILDYYLQESYTGMYSLVVADYLGKGLEYLENNTFSIIIVDLTLPDSFGLDTFTQIFEKSPDTPIIVLTGIEDESMGVNALKLGAQDFLVKGKVRSKGLRRSIKYSIERYKLLKELSENTRKLKEKTEDLSKEKQKLSEAQKLAHIGNWEWDISNNEISWSEELYNIFGLSPDEFHPNYENYIKLIHPEDRKLARKVIEEALRKALPFNFYHRILRKDGSVRTIQSRGEIIASTDGKPEKMLGTGQDVTERLHEEELEKLVLAATKSFNSVVIYDHAGRIEWVNEGFTRLSGYLIEDLKNTKGEILKHDDQQNLKSHNSVFKNVISSKKAITYENMNFAKDGNSYWMLTTLTPVLGKTGEVERVIGIGSDISLRKQIEEELIQANKIAEHSLLKGNKALDELMKAKKQLEETMIVKEQFLANMSHEIRTPMNAIVGFTSLLLKGDLSNDQKQYIEAIKTSGENLLVIINDILDFSRVQSGKITFEKIDFYLSQLISTLTELLLHKSIEKNIRLSTRIAENIPDRLLGDPTRLNQILLNLMGNAIKFTEKGEVKLNIELISSDAENVELKFSVTDTGIGIPEDKLSAIFEGFTQATNDTTRKYGGSGLGLTIVKQLIEAQGGSISVTSKQGEGSTFSFQLKFGVEKDQEIKKQTIKQVEMNEEGIEGLNILLVEDNHFNQILAQKVLSDWKCNVDTADNGLIALEKVKENNYDLILMDIQLPEMDGYEATRQIRKMMPAPKCDVPIMAMTAHAITGEADKCFASGMNDYISKPFDQKVLYSKIYQIAHKRQAPETNMNQVKPEKVIQKSNRDRIVDLRSLEELTDNDTGIMKQMIGVFQTQTSESLDKLEEAMKRRDWKTVYEMVHKIKPSVAFIGISRLKNTINDAEQFSSEQIHLEKLPEKVDNIITTCREAIKELDEVMNAM
jgi:PAS domain S-box-containing protein